MNPSLEDTVRKLADSFIPFSVHFPSGSDSKHCVVTVQNAMSPDQLQTLVKLGAAHNQQQGFLVLVSLS